MNLKQAVALVLLGVTFAGESARADNSEEIKELQAQIEALDQKVKILERKGELEKEASVEKAKTTPLLKIDSSGFSIGSADTNFVLQLHGLVQVDNRTFFGDEKVQGNDGFVLRRVRPIFQGTLLRNFDYLIVPEFGGSSPSIVDAYVNYRYQPWLQVRAGRFKTPVGLEQLQSDPVTSFTERSLVTDLIPNRDIGFQIWGDVGGGVLSYAAGVFNGVGDGRNSSNMDFDDNREFAGRIFVQPFKKTGLTPLQGLGIGVAGSYGEGSVTNSTALASSYSTDGQQSFFTYNPAGGSVVADGAHWRISPQAYYYYGPFSLLAEYALSDQRVRRTGTDLTAELQHTAWQISVGWVLTGESASFNGLTPRRAFDPKNGGWGAWQLVARYAQLNIDDRTFPTFANPATSASAANAWAVGLNWYLNKNIRLSTSYSRTDFTGGGSATATSAPGIVTRQPEDVWFTRLQLSF